jgi:diguanylate cyclase (GGDEF)-like protein/PAS domain S-box-containing protein
VISVKFKDLISDSSINLKALSAIMDAVSVPVFMMNMDRRVIFWNSALENLSGIKSIDAIGTDLHKKIWNTRIFEINSILPANMDSYAVMDFIPSFGQKGRLVLVTAQLVRFEKGPAGIVITLEDMTDRMNVEETYKKRAKESMELSLTDGLTGLYNARFFFDQVKAEIDRAERYGYPLSLIILDLDDFKKWNDTWGHQEGNEVLRRVAQVLRHSIRKIDIPFRYGGEEFGIILTHTASRKAVTVAERVRKNLEKEVLRTPGSPITSVTASLGVAQYRSGEGQDSFVKRADANMYSSKRGGKNRVTSG